MVPGGTSTTFESMSTPNPQTAQLRRLLRQSKDVAFPQLREMIRAADRATLDALLELKWFDASQWRTKEGMPFWVWSYFVALRFGTSSDAVHFERKVVRRIKSAEEKAVEDARRFVALALRRRRGRHRGPEAESVVPKTRTKFKAYVENRLGDPRWSQGEALVEIVLEPKFALESLDGLWLLTALMHHASPASLGPLLERQYESPLVQQVLAHAGVVPPDDGRGEALLEAVWADPDADEPRAVYADWLMERGDAYGRFIADQLEGKDPKAKTMALLSWSGIGPLIQWWTFYGDEPSHRVRFRRGFLSGARVSALAGPIEACSRWSTLEVLDVEEGIGSLDDVRLPSLRALGCLRAADLEHVLRKPELVAALVAVGIETPADVATLDQLMLLPNLKLLLLGEIMPDAFDHPLFAKIDELFTWRYHDNDLRPNVSRPSIRYSLGGGVMGIYDEIIARVAGG